MAKRVAESLHLPQATPHPQVKRNSVRGVAWWSLPINTTERCYCVLAKDHVCLSVSHPRDELGQDDYLSFFNFSYWKLTQAPNDTATAFYSMENNDAAVSSPKSVTVRQFNRALLVRAFTPRTREKLRRKADDLSIDRSTLPKPFDQPCERSTKDDTDARAALHRSLLLSFRGS
jgi:hypothetical protein